MTQSALVDGTQLASQYRTLGLLGVGGFGITYLAQDLTFNRKVALKEFFPASIAERGKDGRVVPRSQKDNAEYERLHKLFYHEGQTLARYNYPNIAQVYNIFQDNGTSYLAMEFIDGFSLRKWSSTLKQRPTQDLMDRIFIPVLAAMDYIHKNAHLHRDISPDNIMLSNPDLTPKLIDFGAARSQESQDATAIIKRSFSPLEFYDAGNESAQGAWSDIYSLAATIYFAVTGNEPPQAPARVVRNLEPMIRTEQGKGYRENFLRAVDWGLSLQPTDRPQTIGEWQRLLMPTQDSVAQQARRNRLATKIFISYRRRDSEQVAGRLFDRLSAAFGANEIFYDTAAIPAAVDFEGHISAALRNSACVIAVIGPEWMPPRSFFPWLRHRKSGDHVKRELELAIEYAVPILPVLVAGAGIPTTAQLPGSIGSLTRLNAVEVRGGRDFHHDVNRLVALIAELRPGG